MHVPDLERLKDDLLGFRAELEAPGVREQLLRSGLPRLLATVGMIPDEAASGDVLELGASPYFLSLCLRHVCRGRVAHANYFGPHGTAGCDRLVHQRSGEAVAFEYQHFNVEADDFPYPDASFDAVLFSELIEHLGVNPVRALSEMHRVLRPGGALVLTTPNALSLERLATFVHGGSQMVDRYSLLFGYGGRHNREYHPRELRELLEGCGFAIEVMRLCDLAELPRRERRQRALWRWLLARYGDAPRAEHIFLRARRGERFRWTFPPSLFDNLTFYTLVRYAWVEMGINDSIQCAAGWHALEPRADGALGMQRRIDQTGQLFLKTPAESHGLALEVYAAPNAGGVAAPLHVLAWDRWYGRTAPQHVYVDSTVSVPRGTWQRVALPLGAQRPRPGDEVEVRLTTDQHGGVAVHRVEFS